MKKITQVATAIIMSIFTHIGYAQTPVVPEGDGTEENPFQIAELGNLLWFQQNESALNKHFIQTADIDASETANWYDGSGWNSIGGYDNRFTGSYDGDNFEITGLSCHKTENGNYGLFGYVEGAILKNIILKDVNLVGTSSYASVGALSCATGGIFDPSTQEFTYSYISNCKVTGFINSGGFSGGLCGSTQRTVITNCSFDGVVEGRMNDVGGLVASATNDTIRMCHTSGFVTGYDNIGGLVGHLGNGAHSVISQCWSHANVTATDEYVGGLVGYMERHNLIEKCFATGDVTGGALAGGLVGNGKAAVHDSYATGNVIDGTYKGGLIGWNIDDDIKNSYSIGNRGLIFYDQGTTINSFYDNSGGQTSSGAATGKSTAEMKDINTYTNTATSGLTTAWDFVNNPNDDTQNEDFWQIDENINNGYPSFVWQEAYTAPEVSNTTITDLTSNSVAINYSLTDLGYPNPKHHGVCWNNTGNPTVNDTIIDLGFVIEAGDYSATINDLTSATTYYVRSFAIGLSDTIYGDVVEFTTKIELTIGGYFTVIDKIYDGTTSANIDTINLELNGVSDGHDVSIDEVQAAYNTALAGTNRTVSLTKVTLSGNDADLYYATTVGAPSIQDTILKKDVTISGFFTVEDKIYDQTTNATVLVDSLKAHGILESDTEGAYLYLSKVEFTDANADTNVMVTIKNLYITGNSSVSGNYQLITDSTIVANATISPKEISANGTFTVFDKTYDGTASAMINETYLWLDGVISDDTVEIAETFISFESWWVGENKAVNVDSIVLSGVDSLNYVLNLEGSHVAQANISPKEITIGGWFKAANKAYDGTTDVVITEDSLKFIGLAERDTLYILNKEFAFAQAEAADSIAVNLTNYEYSGTWGYNLNYTVSNDSLPVAYADIYTPVTLNLIASTGGWTMINNEYGNSITVEPGTKVKIEAVAQTGYTFSEWTGDFVSTNSIDTIQVDSAMNVSVNFTEVPTFTVTIDLQGQGDVYIDDFYVSTYSNSFEFNQNTEHILKAIAYNGWEFQGWSGDFESSEDSTSMLLDSDKNITALFTEIAPETHTITFDFIGNGSVLIDDTHTITANSNTIEFEVNTEHTLKAVPDNSWEFTGWSNDLVSDQETITITVDADKSITVTFTDESSITATSQKLIAIWPNPCNDYIEIESVYEIKTVTVYNAAGNALLTDSFNKRINLQNLSKGIYFVKIDTYANSSVIKFTKQ